MKFFYLLSLGLWFFDAQNKHISFHCEGADEGKVISIIPHYLLLLQSSSFSTIRNGTGLRLIHNNTRHFFLPTVSPHIIFNIRFLLLLLLLLFVLLLLLLPPHSLYSHHIYYKNFFVRWEGRKSLCFTSHQVKIVNLL